MGVAVRSAVEAVEAIPDFATVTICASSGILVPDALLAALGDRFRRTGAPRDLTAVFPIAVGDQFGQRGLDHLAEEGMLRRLIGGSFVIGRYADGSRPRITELIYGNGVEAYNLPQGVLMHVHRDIAARRPGVITRVGLHSYVDPRYGGGRLNERTTEDLVRVIELAGEEWLFYPAFPIHAALIRASTADEDGNLTMEREAAHLGVLAQAMAARTCGGTVIAQVSRLAARGTLDPQRVVVPGYLVDSLVLEPHPMQASMVDYDPTLSGEIRAPLPPKALPLDAEKVVARRALREIRQGGIVSLGFGVPGLVPAVALEEGRFGEFTPVIEQGPVRGLPLGGRQFGASRNPEAFLASPSVFDFLDGGGFDLTCLAFAEMDATGSVNVHRLPDLLPGCGGFLDIVSHARKIVFCGYFTAGGLRTEVRDGRLHILEEGRHRKFVTRLQHVTFNAPYHLGLGKEILYLTERAVFRLEPEGLTLIEVAPGIDPERQILPLMDFRPRIAPDLRSMDPALFFET